MSTELIIALVAVGWVGFGPALSLLMGRRGHSAAAWGVTGMFLGPLAVPLALEAARRHHVPRIAVLKEGTPGPGSVSVLAGIDGSEESRAALMQAVGLLGDRIGRLTLVHVATVDAATDDVLMEGEAAAARTWFAAARRELGERSATECVVAGRPATTLAGLATQDGYDVLVVGRRGRGMSPRVLGSVATALAGQSSVTVLVGGAGTPPPGLDSTQTIELDLATQ